MIVLCIQFLLIVFSVVYGINIWAVYRSDKYLACLKRQIEFLRALWAEFNHVKHSVEETVNKARQVGADYQNLKEAIRLLKEEEVHVSATARVLEDATRHVEEKKRGNANSISRLRNINRMVAKIEEHLRENKEKISKLCESLEQLRSRVRRLQDRPIGKTQSMMMLGKTRLRRSSASDAVGKRSLIRGKIAEELRVIEMNSMVVEAFLNDLRWVKLESENEKAWVKEAIRVIDDAEKYLFAVSEEEKRIERWPVAFGIRHWWAYWNLMNRIEFFKEWNSNLVAEKNRYGIQFIRRVSPNQRRPRRHHIHESSVRSFVENIRDKVSSGSARSSVGNRVDEVCKLVEETLELLRDTGSEGAVDTRNACFNLLLETIEEMEMLVRHGVKRISEGTITGFTKKVDLIKEMVETYSIKIVKDSCLVVGLEKDVNELVSVLTAAVASTSNVGKPDLCVVAVVGIRGIGKTTLANEILNNASIVKHFTTRSLVTFEPEDDSTDELLLLRKVGTKIGLETNVDDWTRTIKKFLKKNACLLVLDNLPSIDVWDKLRIAFPKKSKSTIIITTRSTVVASRANPRRIHWLRLRTEEESWVFFTQMVDVPSDGEDKIAELAKDVVTRTGGLPQSILQLGYLFSGKALTEEDLSSVLKRQDLYRDIWSETWEINRNDLQSKTVLGKCYSYCEFFPEDYNIPARRLVALWAASKSVKSEEIPTDRSKPEEGKKHETDALDCLQQLVDRHMIRVIDHKRNGKIKTCRFPRPLREIWLQNKQKETARPREWSLFACSNQQLAYHFNDSNAGPVSRNKGFDFNTITQDEKYPKSIMFFDTRDGKNPGEDIGNFLQKGFASSQRRFDELLVLDLEGVFMPHLPSSIGKLRKLTYLGLRWTCLEILPKSIGDMSRLQTLDLKHTYVQKLRSSMQKLKMLRHLYLNQHCQIQLTPKLATSMKNLQTLSGVFLPYKDINFSFGFENFQNLEKLEITMSGWEEEKQMGLVNGIMKLSHLRSLSLRSMDEKSEPQSLRMLTSLAGLTNLNSLYLLGKLEEQSLLDNLPLSLTELTLSASKLEDNPIPKLRKLEKLQFLSLLSDSYLMSEMVLSEEDFKNLLVLRIWSLPALERLEVKEGALPKIREFEIRSCEELKCTVGLTKFKTLQVLKLRNMPDEEIITQDYFEANEHF